MPLALRDCIRTYDDMVPPIDRLRWIGDFDSMWAESPSLRPHGCRPQQIEDLDRRPTFLTLHPILVRCLRRYLADVPGIGELGAVEPPSLIRFAAGESPDPPMLDSRDVPTSSRAVSAILFLDDADGGGEVRFDAVGIEVSPEAGRALLFPSGFPFSHASLAPEIGVKHVIASWFHFGEYGHLFRCTKLPRM